MQSGEPQGFAKVKMRSGKNLIKKAVQFTPGLKRRGLLERLFAVWFDGFVYNQIWEDPRVDLEALRLTPESRIVTISSAGCNVLNYLTALPHSITAVDLNPNHMYLTRLKIAAVGHLPDYEAFFRFFAEGNSRDNVASYFKYVRQHLDLETRDFWEGGSWLRTKFKRQRINYFAKNFYDHSRSAIFLRFVHAVCKLAKCDPKKVLSARTRAEQQQMFDKYLAPSFDHWLVKALGKMPFMLFSLGIPPQQFASMQDQAGSHLIDLFRERVRKLACDFPINENYFAWQAFGRRYNLGSPDYLPDYLRPDQFEKLKGNINRVSTHIGSLIEFLQAQPAESFDRFILLDSQDWMPPAVIASLWKEIARVGKSGTRIIFRTAAAGSPIESALPQELSKQFVYEAQKSAELFTQDRAAIYGGFHLYRMAR